MRRACSTRCSTPASTSSASTSRTAIRPRRSRARKPCARPRSASAVEVGILADLPGPKIRIERFAEGRVQLKAGDRFDLVASADAPPGTQREVGVSYLGLPRRRASPATCCCSTTA